MALFSSHVPFTRRFLFLAAAALVFALSSSPPTFAQRVRAGGPRIVAPPAFHPAVHPPVQRPPIVAGRPVTGLGVRGFIPGRHPLRIFPLFVAPFVRFERLGFNAAWWPTYCPFWGWGLGCTDFPAPSYAPENYMTQPQYQPPVVYVYGADRWDRVQLFLKDGTVYNVNDYWFVNDQLHFTMSGEGTGKAGEHVVDLNDLDLQRTIDVNTQRGFRFVMRNEPWEQYLQHHPDSTPPVVQAPPQN